jgi:transcriptional regulator with PAS, ATPase and Fis domain
VARAIHRLSAHSTAPFIVVNGPTLTATVAGAPAGTIFVDALGELSFEMQSALIRALDHHAERDGRGTGVPRHLRVVAASDTDLDVERQRGRVRTDLYYRLKPFELVVPPLRQRSETDLRDLVDATLARLSARRGGLLAALAPDIWERFARYAWPGNVRELGSVLERMVVAAGEETLLTSRHLPDYLRRSIDAGGGAPGASGLLTRRDPASPVPDATVQGALARNDYKQGRAASELGISRHQLYRLLKRSGTREALAGRAIG